MACSIGPPANSAWKWTVGTSSMPSRAAISRIAASSGRLRLRRVEDRLALGVVAGPADVVERGHPSAKLLSSCLKPPTTTSGRSTGPARRAGLTAAWSDGLARRARSRPPPRAASPPLDALERLVEIGPSVHRAEAVVPARRGNTRPPRAPGRRSGLPSPCRGRACRDSGPGRLEPEQQAEPGTLAWTMHPEPGTVEDRLELRVERRRQASQARIELRLGGDVEEREPGHDRDEVGVVGAAVDRPAERRRPPTSPRGCRRRRSGPCRRRGSCRASSCRA